MNFPKFKSAPVPNEKTATTDLLSDDANLKKAAFEKEALLAKKIASDNNNNNSLTSFKIDKKGDFEIARFDYKLSTGEIPVIKKPLYTKVLGIGNVEFIKTFDPFLTESDDKVDDARYFKTIKEHEKNLYKDTGKGIMSLELEMEFDYVAEFIEIPISKTSSFDYTSTLPLASVIERNASLKKKIQTEPHVASNWIEYVDAEGVDKKIPLKARRERQIAILEAALRKNPDAKELALHYLKLQSDVIETRELYNLWKLVVRKFKGDWELEFEFLDFYKNECFGEFHVEQLVQMIVDIISRLKSLLLAQADQYQAKVNLNYMTRALTELIHILVMSGQLEKAIVIVLMLLANFLGGNMEEVRALHSDLRDSLINAYQANSMDMIDAELQSAFDPTVTLKTEPFEWNDLANVFVDLMVDEAFLENTIEELFNTVIGDNGVAVDTTVGLLNSSQMCLLGKFLVNFSENKIDFHYHLAMAMERVASGNGLEYIKGLLAKDSQRFDLWYDYGRILYTKKRFDELVRVISKLLSSPIKIPDTERFKLLLCIVNTLTVQERSTEAQTFILKEAKCESNSHAALLKAIQYYQSIDNENAKYILDFLNDPLKALQQMNDLHNVSSKRADIVACKKMLVESKTREEGSLNILSFIKSFPYSKVSALRAARSLRACGYLTEEEVNEICIVLEEKGCTFYYVFA